MLNFTKRIIFSGISLLLGASFCLLPVLRVRAADDWEEFLAGIGRLQQLAEEYAGEPGGSALLLTMNYLRAERYSDVEWDLVLGAADAGFAALVEQRAPELADLQTVERLTTPQGEEIDAIHLIATLAGSAKQSGMLCGWGGDCMQLTEQFAGQADSVDGYYAVMQPVFSGAENASRFPQSDLLADLDGMVLGATLQPEDDLAQHLAGYYADVTRAARAEKFIQAQLGGADTGDRQALYQAFETALLDNDGMKLFLMLRGHAELDEEQQVILDPDTENGMRAAARLMADWLADALDGAVVSPPGDAGEVQPSPSPDPGAGLVTVNWLQARLLALVLLGGAAVLLLTALTVLVRSWRK